MFGGHRFGSFIFTDDDAVIAEQSEVVDPFERVCEHIALIRRIEENDVGIPCDNGLGVNIKAIVADIGSAVCGNGDSRRKGKRDATSRRDAAEVYR